MKNVNISILVIILLIFFSALQFAHAQNSSVDPATALADDASGELTPWWRTTWFIRGVVALMLALGFGLHEWRIRAIKRQKRLLGQQIAERTVELRQINERLQQEIVERKQAEASSQQRNQELVLLNQVGQLLNSTIEWNQVLETILQEMSHLLDITASSFWIRLPETGELLCQQATGPKSEEIIGCRLAPGQGIVGQAAQIGTIINIGDTRTDTRHYKEIDQKTEIEYRSILSIPFRLKGSVIGVLNLVDTRVNRFAENELRLVESITASAASAIENARLYQELQQANELLEQRVQERTRELAETIKAKERIESELRIAHDIQMESLPRTFPAFPDRPEIDIYAVLEPAKEVGGDFYDFFFTDEQHLWFVIGDVSDKGVPAALFMSAVKTLLRTTATQLSRYSGAATIRPDTVLASVNRELSFENDSCMFTTVFCGVLNVSTGQVDYTSAGHDSPLLLRQDHEAEFIPRTSCMSLGVDEDASFTTAPLRLLPGETILVYTDGITEAFNLNNEMFSEERLQAHASCQQGASAEELVRGVLEEVRIFSEGVPQSDDITILALTYLQNHTT